MADVQESHGIKLFGATIEVQVRKAKEEPKKSDDQTIEKRPDKIIPCPRCKSTETKFCYFNNYNVNQPRHFCKGCQRYWTAGGALRNVPVGAGRRKNKPPSRGFIDGFLPESCFFDASTAHGTQQFEFDEMVEVWQLAAAHGSFNHAFPAKRCRSGAPVGQS